MRSQDLIQGRVIFHIFMLFENIEVDLEPFNVIAHLFGTKVYYKCHRQSIEHVLLDAFTVPLQVNEQ